MVVLVTVVFLYELKGALFNVSVLLSPYVCTHRRFVYVFLYQLYFCNPWRLEPRRFLRRLIVLCFLLQSVA